MIPYCRTPAAINQDPPPPLSWEGGSCLRRPTAISELFCEFLPFLGPQELSLLQTPQP